MVPLVMSALVVGTPTASDAESVPLRRTAPSIKLPAQSADEARLELVDQRLAVDPNGTIELRYLLTGLTGDPLQLVPPEPAPEPPTTDPTTDPTNPVPPAEIPEPPAPEPAPESPPPLILKITNYEPLVDPADVASVVGSDIDPAAFEEVGDAVDGLVIADARPLLTRNDDATVSLDLDIETDVVESIESRLKLDQPGIYPLRVQLLSVVDGAEQLIATAGTVIQRIAGAVDVDVDTPPPVDLSVVTATPVPPPDAGEPILDVARVRLDDAVQLAAAVDAPVTLEVPPTLIAEQTTTPAAADQLAEALADDELVALPIVPLDVSSAVAAGVADAYARLLGAGDDLLTESLPTTASRRDIWIATEPLSSSGAQLLRDLGTRFVVIPEALYIDTIDEELPPSDRFVQAELPDGGTLPFLVVDPIADQLTTAAADRVLARSTTTEWAVDTLATLLLDQHDDNASGSSLRPTSPPRRSRVLTTPDLSAPDARLIQALDDLAATTPAVRFAPASALIGLTDVLVDRSNDPVTVELPDVAGPSLSARVELIDRTGLALASAASMLADDDPRIAAWTTVLNTLISTGYTDDAARMIADDLIAKPER